MISVSDALEHLFTLATPLGTETVALRQAAGRWLSAPVEARRSQPPFDASAMDGYAVKAAEVERDAQFKIIGEAAAGHGFSGSVKPGQAVRIFTGAPMPAGADCVVIQEDVRRSGDLIAINADTISAGHVRPAGGDFREGMSFAPDRALTPSDIALLAAMNHDRVEVWRRPVVAIIATGDELVQPGETPGPDQIIASNSYGLAAMVEAQGGVARLLPIARDNRESLATVFGLARGADLVVTIGGASVGDHDLVGQVAAELGMEQSFYKIAMRPGKPLMAGRLAGTPMLGLPGNPVSAMVCGHIFMSPMLRVMQGQPVQPVPRQRARLIHALGSNGPREHYMRARVTSGRIDVFDNQDSALLNVLTQANALAIRPPHDGARATGDEIEFTLL